MVGVSEIGKVAGYIGEVRGRSGSQEDGSGWWGPGIGKRRKGSQIGTGNCSPWKGQLLNDRRMEEVRNKGPWVMGSQVRTILWKIFFEFF
jgi:hypothetical protein